MAADPSAPEPSEAQASPSLAVEEKPEAAADEAAEVARKEPLAARLKEKGADLMGDVAPLSAMRAELSSGGVSALTSHAELGTAKEQAVQKRLFTPLALQDTKAQQDEKKRKEQAEMAVVDTVRKTLRKWVQETLSQEELGQKRQAFMKKGILKCKVKATWSEGLHEKLKELVAEYGAKLMADGEKANGDGKSATPWLARNERWLVGFDVAAFQRYINKHPEVVDPPEEKVRHQVDEFMESVDVQTMRIRDLYEHLAGRFGPLRRQLLERTRQMAGECIERRSEAEARELAKKSGKRKAEAQLGREIPSAKKGPAAGKGKGKGGANKEIGKPKARIENHFDAIWAAGTMAPLGLWPDGSPEAGTPVVRASVTVLAPILEGLKEVHKLDGFREILKRTGLGKILNSFRHHPVGEIAKTCRELVANLKVACAVMAESEAKTAEKGMKGHFDAAEEAARNRAAAILEAKNGEPAGAADSQPTAEASQEVAADGDVDMETPAEPAADGEVPAVANGDKLVEDLPKEAVAEPDVAPAVKTGPEAEDAPAAAAAPVVLEPGLRFEPTMATAVRAVSQETKLALEEALSEAKKDAGEDSD